MTDATPLASEQITQPDWFDDILFLRSEIDALFARTKGHSLRAKEWNDRGHAILDRIAALSATPAPSDQAGCPECGFNTCLCDASPNNPHTAVEYPAGAIENGREFLRRLGEYDCEAGPISMSVDYIEAVRCFEWLVMACDRMMVAPSDQDASQAQGERALAIWERACVGREGYCSSDLQDAAIEAIKQAFREAEAAARSATLPAHFQWSESNREKFEFGRDTAADLIATLSTPTEDARERVKVLEEALRDIAETPTPTARGFDHSEWMALAFDGVQGIARAALTDKGPDGLTWLSVHPRCVLEHFGPVYGDDDDQSTGWRVMRENGPINDREWEEIGRGDTPAAALAAARTALGNKETDRHG